MRKIESYDNEQGLIGRIEQLKADGIQEESITVVSKEALEGSSLDYTNVNFKSADGTAWDKIVSFFSSEDPKERVISSLDLSEQEEQKYKSELDSGKILLYVHGEGSDTAAKEPVADDSQDTVQPDEQTKEDAANMTAVGAAGTAGVAGVTAHDDIAGRTATEEEIRQDVPRKNTGDDSQDTVQPDEQTKEDATNMTAAGTAGNAGVAGVTAHDDNAGKTATEEEIKQDIPRENTGNGNEGTGTRTHDDNTEEKISSGEYDDTDDQSANQIHNPANEEGVSLSKSQEAHDHSEKLPESDTHMAYDEGTDEHIAVDPSVNTDSEKNDMEKIERHKDPEYLEGDQNEYDYGDKETVINEYKMEDRRHQHVVNTHNHPELAEEVSPEDEERAEDGGRQPLDKNPDNKNRDYSIKNDVNGEQVIRLDDEDR